MVKSLGADEVIDYTVDDFSSKGKTYDVIFDTVGKSSFSACMKSLKKDGTYINLTVPLPGVRMLWTKLTSSKKLILGQNSPESSEASKLPQRTCRGGKVKSGH